MTTLYLIRHAETDWNRAGMFQGHADTDLSERGHGQVRALARRFADIPLDLVVSSDLRRARETATGLTQGCRTAPSLEVDPRLREMDFGAWEGLRLDDIRRLYPADLAAYRADPVDGRPTGGESFRDAGQRALAAVTEHAARPGVRRLAVVSHGGTLKALLCLLLGVPLGLRRQLLIDNASVTAVELREGQPALLRYLNDTCHLRS